jgi:hypothetical protein
LSGNILNSRGIRVGIESGASIFDLNGKKVYDLKGINIYRLSGELVGHLMDALGSDRRLDRDSEGLFAMQGRPQPDKPEDPPGPRTQLSGNFKEAIRLRRTVSDTPV